MPRHLPVLLADRLYVPAHKVTQEHLEAFTHTITQTTYVKEDSLDKRCGTCTWWMKPWKDKAGNKAFCHEQGYGEYDKCGDYEARSIKNVEELEVRTYKTLHQEGYVAFARGDYKKLREVFGDKLVDRAEDERSTKPIGIPLEFGGPRKTVLRKDQVKITKRWLRKGGGLLKSPTGTGKGVMLVSLICEIGMRTLILASEERHLTTVMAELKTSSNIDELQKEYDEPLMGIFTNQGRKGGRIYPITLSTFQAFGSKRGKKARKKLRDKFGLVFVEEVHRSAATTWFKTASAFNARWRGGSSATMERKDKLECVIFDAIGPVVAEGHAKVMQCEVTYINSGIYVPDQALKRYGAYPWSGMLTYVSKQELVDLVVLNVVSDIQKGYKPLVISERRNFAIAVSKGLEALGFKVKLLMGGAKKAPKKGRDIFEDPWKPINDALGNGSLHAVVGTGVLNEAVNIPNLSSLHLPHPSANPSREEQRAGRIRRVVEGKQTPQIRVYTFEGATIASVGCRKTRQAVYERLGFRTKGERTHQDIPEAQEQSTPLKVLPGPEDHTGHSKRAKSGSKIRSLDSLPPSRKPRSGGRWG